MKKIFYKTVKVTVNDITYLDKCFFIDYYILKSKKSTEENGLKKSYGIGVVKHYTDYFENDVVQEARVCDITEIEEEIHIFAEILAKNNIAPDKLKNFSDDYFADDSFEESAV